MPSRLSRLTGWRQISTIIPIYKTKNDLRAMFHHKHIAGNLWSNIRWQWWQPVVLATCHRIRTWFHHRSSPSICGKPVQSHFGNSRISWFTFCRFSFVINMILTCTSKGKLLPNGLSLGSTNPLYFMLTCRTRLWPLRSVPPYSSTSMDQSPTLARTFFHRRKKCTHWGYLL